MKYGYPLYFVFLMFFAFGSGCAMSKPMKDAELIAAFKERRSDFEKLKQMATEDSGSIGYISEKTLKKSALSENRQNEYYGVFAQNHRSDPTSASGTSPAGQEPRLR